MLPDILPDLSMDGSVRNGRVPREAYQRGWGIQFGGLREKIAAEPLFREVSERADAIPSLVALDKRLNLYLLITRFLPRLAEKNIVEFGSYRGGNALFMGLLLAKIAPTARVYALDTYAGMPTTDRSIDAHSAGDFGDASLQQFRDTLDRLEVSNVVPVQGLFNETFPHLAPGARFALAHIDADIYPSVKYAQDAVWDRMTKGGYLVYDDAEVSSCIGATQAVEELIMQRRVHSEQIWPHFVFRVGI